MSMLEVNELYVRLGSRRVIGGASFEINEGLTMLLGRNGCGKSTLIRALLGLIPSKGRIAFRGSDITALNSRRRAQLMAYLPQRQTIPAGISVLEYAALGGYARGGLLASPGRESYDAASAELDRAGIAHLKGRMLTEVSGGEARLAGLARARVQKSPLMLMDEPLAGLDIAKQHEFLAQVKADGFSILMSLHDPMLAWRYADRLLVMDEGGISAFTREDEAAFEKKLTLIYGAGMRFEQVGDMRLPIWHD